MSKVILITDDVGSNVMGEVTFPESINMVCGFVTAYVKELKKNPAVNEEDTNDLFNFVNEAFSKCLELAFPEQELRPDLTVEAIMKLEDEILQSKATELPTSDFDKVQFAKKHKTAIAKSKCLPQDHLKPVK